MSKKLLFVVLAAVTVTGAFAETTTQTIPTQGYVDDNFQTKIPAKSVTWSYGNNTTVMPSVITATDTAGTVDQRGIYSYDYSYYDALVGVVPDTEHYLPEMGTLNSALEYISGIRGSGNLVDANSSPWLLVPDDSKVGFKHIATVNSAASMRSSNDPSQYIPTMKAMEEKQNKMTCTRWLDNADETDENCLLWSIAN